MRSGGIWVTSNGRVCYLVLERVPGLRVRVLILAVQNLHVEFEVGPPGSVETWGLQVEDHDVRVV